MLTKRQMRHFEQARRAAELSDYRKAMVGAVVVQGTQILSVGFSSHRTHPLQSKYNVYRNLRDGKYAPQSLHAETMALAPLVGNDSINWGKVELYVYRLRRDQPYGMARPCAACMKLIADLGVRHIFYTSDVGFVYEEACA